MSRRIALPAIAVAVALAAAACSQQSGPKKTGPVVATGKGITITADEVKARLDEQSPFVRGRYTTLERKKEFLDNMIRTEVLAKEAERRGLDKDPEFQAVMRRMLMQRLLQTMFQDQSGAKDVPEAEVAAYYEAHKADYFRPKQVRASIISFKAAAGTPDRAKKQAAAKKVLAKIKADEKKNPLAFAAAAKESSEDATTKAVGGDLGPKSRDDLEKAWGKAVAEAAFSLKANETSGLVEDAQGIYLVRVSGVQEEVNRSLDQVKGQIAGKLYREKKTKEFEELVKKLRDEAAVTVDDKALEAVQVAAAPAGAPGGMPPGMMGAPGMPPGMPPHAAPAPAPAPAPQK